MKLLCSQRVISFVYVSKNFSVLFSDDKCVFSNFVPCNDFCLSDITMESNRESYGEEIG